MATVASPNVKTAARTLDAFEAFARLQRSLTLSELAAAIDAPLSSCHGLVATLKKRGYIYSVSGNRQVYPTRRMLDVAESIVRNDPLLEIVSPVLTALRDDTRETVILGTREGNAVLYLDVVEGLQTIRYSAQPGDIKPLYSSAIGKAVLGGLSEEALLKVLSQISLDQVTPATLVDVDAIQKDLHIGRQRGFYITQGENVTDVMGLAALVPTDGQTIAIGLAGPVERMIQSMDSSVEKLLDTVRKLSNLGIG